jgi:molecular chaperone HtpG
VMANLKKTLTGKVLSELKRMAQKDKGKYFQVYVQFGRFIRQGIAVSPQDRSDIEPLLYFPSSKGADEDELFSLDEYVGRMAANQEDIYYILGDDFTGAARSPHLDAFRQRGVEVLYMTDPVDPFMVMSLPDYKDHKLRSVDEAGIDLGNIGEAKEDETPVKESLPEDSFTALRQKFVDILGERVRDVRESKTLTGSPARLISDESSPGRNMFRINRLLDRDYELPVKILELNPRHPLMHNLSQMVANAPQNPLINAVAEQVFETALLQDGIHPDPAAMANRLTLLMEAATGTPASDLHFPAASEVAAESDEGGEEN